MVFSSMIFLWVFLPVVLVANFIFYVTGGSRLSNALLLAASILFYAWGEPHYVILILCSIALNWLSGILYGYYDDHRKAVLIFSVTANLLILGYFKYAALFVETVNLIFRTAFAPPDIPLPIGISFFTFQALSYSIDVYRGKVEAQRDFFKLALYISFFPQLIAGPIIQYKDISGQIDRRQISQAQTVSGIRRFVYGLGKKVLIANVLGQYVDQIYALDISHISSLMAWAASLCYTFQIYYDFSGYSDMAIGLGRMFGFDFKENFRYPYLSKSVSEFWRRWHISLGAWFKEYVYIPLGGNRHGRFKTNENLLIVFLLTGIWHGAYYAFLLWGLYHGMLCVLERISFRELFEKYKPVGLLYTFLTVNFGWVLFRSEHLYLARAMLQRMLHPFAFAATDRMISEYATAHTLFALLCAVAGMGVIQQLAARNAVLSKWKGSVLEAAYCALIFLLSVASIAASTYNPFIYFRF